MWRHSHLERVRPCGSKTVASDSISRSVFAVIQIPLNVYSRTKHSIIDSHSFEIVWKNGGFAMVYPYPPSKTQFLVEIALQHRIQTINHA